MFLYRNLELNISEQHTNWLKDALEFYLQGNDSSFEWGCVGITKLPVEYNQLPPENQSGHQIMLTFWTWGDTSKETFDNLERLFRNIFETLKQIELEIKESTKLT